MPYLTSGSTCCCSCEAYCLAPSYNPGNAIVSNGVEWTIGNY